MSKLHPGQPRCQLLDRTCVEFSTSDEQKVFELIETKKGEKSSFIVPSMEKPSALKRLIKKYMSTLHRRNAPTTRFL